MVVPFEPFTVSLSYQANKWLSLVEKPVDGHTYKIVLDATTDSDANTQIYVGTLGGRFTAVFSYGQNGIETREKKVTYASSVNFNKSVAIYCRASSNDGKSHTITVRNLEIYDIT